MSEHVGETGELFAFFDWLPLPSRMTPAARPKQGMDPGTVTVRLSRDELDERLLEFKSGCLGLPEPDSVAQFRIKRGEDERPLLEEIDSWLGEDNRELAVGIDTAGLVVIVIRAPYTAAENKSPRAGNRKLLRELVRNRVRADNISMLVHQLLRHTISETHADDGALHRISEGRNGLYAVDALAVDMVAVDVSAFVGQAPETICAKLLSTKELFTAKTETAGVGGPPAASSSPSALLSISTRYGALVDRTLPALEEENAVSGPEQARTNAFITRYRSGSFVFALVFVGLAVVPSAWPAVLVWLDDTTGNAARKWVSDSLHFTMPTVFEFALFFLLFFLFALVTYAGTFGEELRAQHRRERLALVGARQQTRRGPLSALLRLCGWWVNWYGLLTMSLLLCGAWLALALMDVPPQSIGIPDSALPGSATLRKALKAAVWGLPAVGFTMLKYGDDRLATLVKTVFERENRLAILGGLESALNQAQRFATNIKSAFRNFEKDKVVEPLLARLLVFAHAKEDIESARRKIAAIIGQAQSEHTRRAAVTALLGFLLLSGSVIGKLEPEFIQHEKRKDDLAAAERAALENLGWHLAFRPGGEIGTAGLLDRYRCFVRDDKCKPAEEKVYMDTLASAVMAARIERRIAGLSMGLRDQTLNVRLGDIEGEIEAAFSGAYIGGLKPRLRSMLIAAVNEAFPLTDASPLQLKARRHVLAGIDRAMAMADAGPLEGKTAEAVRAGTETGFETAYAGAIKLPFRDLVRGAIEDASRTWAREDMQKIVTTLMRDAMTEAAGVSDFRPIEPQAQETMRRAVEGAVRDADLFRLKVALESLVAGIEPSMRETFSTAIRGSVNEAYIGEIVKRFRPEIIEAISQALRQKYQLEGYFVPPVPEQCRGGLMARVYYRKPFNTNTFICKYVSPANEDSHPSDLASRCAKVDPESGSLTLVEAYAAEAGVVPSLLSLRTELLKSARGKEILVVGYSDSAGRPEQNLVLATRRATKIKELLTQQDDTTIDLTVSAIGRGEETQSRLSNVYVPAESYSSRRADIYVCRH